MTLPGTERTTARWVQPPGLRRAAWVVGACGIGLIIWSLIVSGWDAFAVLFLAGMFVAAPVAALRQRVTVDATEIVICNGLWTRRIQRPEIRRLQWLTSREVGWPAALAQVRGAGMLYVVSTSGRPVAVPATDTRNVEAPRRGAASMAAWLSAAAALPIQAGVVPEVDEWDWD